MSQIFKFKQFDVVQDHSAMKIGMDGVLLGAWAEPGAAKAVLDIGSGTGVISLMLAQRNSTLLIDAIEIEEGAYLESKLNFRNSPWSERLNAFHNSIQDYVDNSNHLYDFIISNPPFFNSGFSANDEKRAMARNRESLSYEMLLSSVDKLLKRNGSTAFVIPYQTEDLFLSIASRSGLYPFRITHVKGNQNSKIKRSLIQLSKLIPKKTLVSCLVIELSRHVYTEEYVEIVKEFYLKM